MAEYVNTVESFKLFLEDFSKHEQPTDETPHPFHPQSSTVVEREIEGEILDWALTILEQCPDFLKFSIAREVANTIFHEGFEQYKAEIEISTEIEKIDEDKKEQNDTTDHVAHFSTAALAKSTFLTVYKVCAKWHKELPDFKVPPLNVYSAHGIKNTRRKMEDKHTVITNLNALLDLKDERHTQYYAVFDGHGGLDASIYASKHLHVMLSRQETFGTNVEEALKKSILELDAEYCKKSERDSLRSGTTAVIAVIRENVLYIAWIGDSQTVLIRDGQEVELMEPHKPDRPDEKQRIEDLGGCVIWFGAWRVNGTLSVSRAIGDAEFKPFVSGDADTSKTELNDTDDYLCIACDGLWDVFNGKQLAQLVSQHMQESGDKSSLSRVLCGKAKDAGSSDNITVLIIFFKDVITVVKEETANTQEAVENDDEENADSSDSSESKPDVPNGDSTAAVESKMAEDQDSSKPDSSSVDPPVIVQGSKLQPGVKERPPHKLFVNKPQGLVPKVNVLVTDTAPHAKLPHSVVTHKPHWQKSPVMERRDTRGSLFSLSTVESEEITMPLTFGSENRLNVNGLNTQSGFPVIIPAQRERRPSPVRNTPSPSVMSEPAIPGEGFVVLHYPSKPSPQRHSNARKTYRTSIIMNHPFMDDGSDAGILGYQRPKLLRRASRSVPDHLNRLSKTLQLSQWPGSRSHHRFGQSQPNSYFPVKNPRNGFQKENIVPIGFPNAVYGTEIAITNSLYNKIKPKRNGGRRMSSNSMRYHEESPVQFPYRWQKN